MWTFFIVMSLLDNVAQNGIYSVMVFDCELCLLLDGIYQFRWWWWWYRWIMMILSNMIIFSIQDWFMFTLFDNIVGEAFQKLWIFTFVHSTEYWSGCPSTGIHWKYKQQPIRCAIKPLVLDNFQNFSLPSEQYVILQVKSLRVGFAPLARTAGSMYVWQNRMTVKKMRTHLPVFAGYSGTSIEWLHTSHSSCALVSLLMTFCMCDQNSASRWLAGQIRLCVCKKTMVSGEIFSKICISSSVAAHEK